MATTKETAGKTAQDLLREAATLVDLAVLKLDMTETRCECCEGKKFRNRVQATIYSRHSDLPTRLRNSAEDLDKDAAHRRGEEGR